jgi:putative transposase
MANIRMHFENAVHFVTNRCEQEQFLLLPKGRVNDLVREWLARAYLFVGGDIGIYAFVFLSNHFHLLLCDTSGCLARFMCFFEANLARAVNRELGRHGSFWAREYDDVIVDGNDAFLDRYAYVLCNAAKAGLVDRAADWIGVTSLDHSLRGEPLEVEALNRTRLHQATRRGQKVDRMDFVETLRMPLAVPPMWTGLKRRDVATRILELVRAGEAAFRAKRGDKRALGVRAVLRQTPTDRPLEPSFRPRIRFLCKDPCHREELLAAYRAFVGAYREAYGAFLGAARCGRRPAAKWPAWSFPPSCWTPMGITGAPVSAPA